MIFRHRLKANRTKFPIFIVLLVLIVAASLYVGLVPTEHKLPAIDTAATVTPQGTYLDFTKIGVKVTLGSSVDDAVYAPFNVPSTDGSQVFGISSQSLIDDSNSNSCAAAMGPLGIVIATTNPTVVTGPASTTQLTPDNKTVFKIDSTYYRYVPPQDYGCNGGNVTSNQVQAAQNAFAQSFASLQSDSSSTAPTGAQ